MFRVLNIESSIVTVQYRADIVNDNRIASLLEFSGGQANTQLIKFHISQLVIGIIYPINNTYLINDNPYVNKKQFQMIFEGVKNDEEIRILASTDERIHRNYSFPVIEEVIFPDGGTFAGENNPSQLVS